MDAFLKGPEADSLVLEPQALSNAIERHEVVVSLGELARPIDSGLSERKITIVGRHGSNSRACSPFRQPVTGNRHLGAKARAGECSGTPHQQASQPTDGRRY
jgi:hypothetical protein